MLSSASSSSLPPNETRSLTLAEGRWSGWIKRDGRKLSVWWKTRHAGSEPGSVEFAFNQALKTSAPAVFFPHRGPGEEENGRARGAGSLSEKKAMRVRREARRCSRSESNQNQRARHLHGLSPGRKHTRCDRHRRAGLPCTSRSNGAALERRFALLEKLRDRRIAAANGTRNCCDAVAR